MLAIICGCLRSSQVPDRANKFELTLRTLMVLIFECIIVQLVVITHSFNSTNKLEFLTDSGGKIHISKTVVIHVKRSVQQRYSGQFAPQSARAYWWNPRLVAAKVTTIH